MVSAKSGCPGTGLGTATMAEGNEDEYEIKRIQWGRTRLSEEASNVTDHEDWIGDLLTVRREDVGLRIGTNNFQRKLYASVENMREHVTKMKKLRMDIMVGTEPGLGSKQNISLLKRTMRESSFKAVTTSRDNRTIGGGIVFTMAEAWARVPHELTAYMPAEREHKGRAAALVFENNIPGMHHKVQIIAVHGLNGAEGKRDEAHRMLDWIDRERSRFKEANPMATTVLIGDLNAAQDTALDTDKGMVREVETDEEEKDAFVLETIKDMHLTDVFRGRFPKLRAVTRTSSQGTNRLLDRVFVTGEAAGHPSTGVAISKHKWLDAGSDHLMVMLDLPIDTAGVALHRMPMWEPRKEKRWVRDIDDMGRTSEAQKLAFNEKYECLVQERGSGGYHETMHNTMEAAQGTLLKQVERQYPNRVSKPGRAVYTAKDHKLRSHLRAVRHLNLQARWDLRLRELAIKKRRQLGGVADSAVNRTQVNKLLGMCKREETQEALDLSDSMIAELEKVLSKKERSERAKQIRRSTKLRNDRFADNGKLMLKMVINSIMRRYKEEEEITCVQEEGSMVFEEEQVAGAVKRFYQEWMASRVGVEERWQGANEGEAWEAMLDLDPSRLVNPTDRPFIEGAYIRSRDKYERMQQEDRIWDECDRACTMQEFRAALMKTKSGSAPGPSGLTYDMLKALSDDNLEPFRDIVNRALAGGDIEADMNKSLLRPIPKTEAGLADLAKTRPIALMEVMLKLHEAILFSRIMDVVKKHDMLRSEQHGCLPGRSVRTPIRILTELIEDAIVTGKELHIFSADITKAFDSLEYWSQAMGWRALGMPKHMVNMLVDMDRGGETQVILGQGRKSGGFASGRGVRQGSVGGPIKWVVFMNFWLEYAHHGGSGGGYRMSEAEEGDREHLGQMFVDDSNWFAKDAAAMTTMVQAGERFVGFHGLSFNRLKSEYVVLNQDIGEGVRYSLPEWSDGEVVQPKMRRRKGGQGEKEALESIQQAWKDLQVGMFDVGGGQVAEQPTEKDFEGIEDAARRWTSPVKEEGPEDLRRDLIQVLVAARARVCGGHQVMEELEYVEQWATLWGELQAAERAVREGRGEATRYLGVFFETNTGWGVQRRILAAKFTDLQERIGSSRPTREQAIYMVNAVINSAIRYPLQVAHIPRTTLRAWDSANRAVIRKAGALPVILGEALHLPKDQGGLGLQSLEEMVGRQRVVDQISWLVADTVGGQTVRAAYRRWHRGGDKGTLQQRTAEALEDRGMTITKDVKELRDQWGRVVEREEYSSKHRQGALDSEMTEKIQASGREVHAFGDGATYASEDRAGWGSYRVEGEGGRVHSSSGRLAGKQSNDKAETMAILQALVNTSPEDTLHIYCDNQGCVDTWERLVTAKGKLHQETQNCRALWNRIIAAAEHRAKRGGLTTMHWVHSHVDDEGRRKKGSTTSKHRCACGGAEGREGCTEPGMRGHWVHEGNAEADTLAGLGAGMLRADLLREVARGEEEFILRKGGRMAEGGYRKFVEEQRDQDAEEQEGNDARGKLAQARRGTHRKQATTMLRALDSAGGVSWRFWVRMTLECLPTHSRMSKFATGTEDNVYAHVYGDTIGPEGKCIRCQGCEKETTRHAIRECPSSEPRWQRLEHQLEDLWQEYDMDWGSVQWTRGSNGYTGWDPQKATCGMVPEQIGERVPMEEPRMYKLVNITAGKILLTAWEAWEDRNDTVLQWIEGQEDLKQRKRAADKTGWRWTKKRKPEDAPEDSGADGEGAEEGSRLARTLRWAKKTKEEASVRVAARVAEAEEGYLKACEQKKELRAHPAELAREAAKSQKAGMRSTVQNIRQVVRRARAAEGTRDLTNEESSGPNMLGTQPALTTCSTPWDHYWVPRGGTQVEALWTGEGEGKVGNQRGKWWLGKVITLTWPEDKGTPGVWIRYKGGHEEWHGLDSCGSTVRPETKPKGKYGKPFTTLFPAEATRWMGIGTRLKVKWRGPGWLPGRVLGSDRHGVIVEYADGSVVAHDDLSTRGCKILEFKRVQDQWEYYQQRPWVRCPYGGDEDDCECWPCHSQKWPRIYEEAGLEPHRYEEAGLVPAWDRMEWLAGAGSRSPLRPPDDNIIQEGNGGHLLADQGCGGEGDRGGNARDHPREEGTDEAPAETCQQGDQHEQEGQGDREGEGRQGLGMGGRGDQEWEAPAEGHLPMDERVARGRGDHPSDRTRGGRVEAAGPSPKRACVQGGGGWGSARLAARKRGEGAGHGDAGQAPETHAASGGEKSDGEEEGRDDGDIFSTSAARSGGESCPGAAASEAFETRGVDHMDPGRGDLDGAPGVDPTPGGSGGSAGGDSPPRTAPGEQEIPGNCGLRGGVERSGVGNHRGLPGHRGRGSGPEGIHKHRSKGRNNHQRGAARVSGREQGRHPDCSGEESGITRSTVADGVCVPRLLTTLNCECNEPAKGGCARGVVTDTAEQEQQHGGEAGSGTRVDQGVGDECTQDAGGARSTPGPSVCAGEPVHQQTVGTCRGPGGVPAQPCLEEHKSRPMRVRKEVTEADVYSDKYQGVEAEGPNRIRKVRTGNMRGDSGKLARRRAARGADGPELEGQAAGPGSAGWGEEGAHAGGGRQRSGARPGNGNRCSGSATIRGGPGTEAGAEEEANQGERGAREPPLGGLQQQQRRGSRSRGEEPDQRPTKLRKTLKVESRDQAREIERRDKVFDRGKG